MAVKMRPVESSDVKAVGYDPERRELHIDFIKTGLYIFEDVDRNFYEAFMLSGSKGRFVNYKIKGKFKYRN